MARFLVFGLLLCAACAGNRGTVNFQGVQYPVSLSPYLRGKNSKLLSHRQGLSETAKLSYATRQWSLLYSYWAISDEGVFAAALNKKISEAGGDAVVNLAVETGQCGWNYVVLFSWFPLWPGCSDVNLSGDIVKYTAGIQVAPALLRIPPGTVQVFDNSVESSQNLNQECKVVAVEGFAAKTEASYQNRARELGANALQILYQRSSSSDSTTDYGGYKVSQSSATATVEIRFWKCKS